MGTTRWTSWMLVAALGLSLNGCLLSTKRVEVPLRDTASAEFTTVGTGGQDTATIDFFEEIENALDGEDSFEEIVSLGIESATWRVLENRSGNIPSATVELQVVVSRGTGAYVPLTQLTIPDLEAVGNESQKVPLDAAGVGLLLAGFDEYVAYKNQGGTQPDLLYRFRMQASSDQLLDVTWEGNMKFTLTAAFEVEIPDPWD